MDLDNDRRREPWLKVLGAYGSRLGPRHTTCFQLGPRVVIDAGHIMGALDRAADLIEHVLLTHAHLDHLLDIPFLIDETFARRTRPVTIHGLPETLAALRGDILNDRIWPDFSRIPLMNSEEPVVRYRPLVPGQRLAVGGVRVRPLPARHIVPTVGYVVEERLVVSGDTHSCDELVAEVNGNPTVDRLFLDVSFPARLNGIAAESLHHSSDSFRVECARLRSGVSVYAYHLKPSFRDEIRAELADLPGVGFLEEGDGFPLTPDPGPGR